MKKNIKTLYWLCLVFFVALGHLIFSIFYADSYEYAKSDQPDLYWLLITYKLTILTILGAIGFVAFDNNIVKLVSFLCLIPGFIILFSVIGSLNASHNHIFLIKNHFSYLSLTAFVINIMVFITICYFVVSSLLKR